MHAALRKLCLCLSDYEHTLRPRWRDTPNLRLLHMNAENLLVELFVEELPPKALKSLGEAFAAGLSKHLQAQGLLQAGSVSTPYASPRRLGAHVTGVLPRADDKTVLQKLMPTAVGLTADGAASPALVKKMQALGLDVADLATAVRSLKRQGEGKDETLFCEQKLVGISLRDGLQKALDAALGALPIPKIMRYQLHQGCELPGWSSVDFVRPAHGLVALHGTAVVPVQALGLQAGNSTQGHRFEAKSSPLPITHADHYAATLRQEGAVIASFAERRAEVERQLNTAAAKLGGGHHPVSDDALLDEVCALVERPNVLICRFEPEFLQVPQECLILTMKANQKYFPLLDANNKLSNVFLVVSNISPEDPSAVIAGNERVIRPRLADAQFFFEQDKKKTLASRIASLDKVVYHGKLGSQGERSQRVQQIAHALVTQWRLATLPYTAQSKDSFDVLDSKAQEAASLAKTDLLTDMVGEFPELQGTMGAYYARHEGLRDGVAIAIEDHYKPRFAGDALPRNRTGCILALADKLETLSGLFGIGQLPTGDKDPFALRRHALGIIRILLEKNIPLSLPEMLDAALSALHSRITDAASTKLALLSFFNDRLGVALREQGHSAQAVDAILALGLNRICEMPKRLEAVRAFAALPESVALAAANKRIANILKKAHGGEQPASAAVLPSLFVEPAEKTLWDTLARIAPPAEQQFATGDYSASLQTLAQLRSSVDAFFDTVMVNADDPALKGNRLAMLAALHRAMNQVADLSKLSA